MEFACFFLAFGGGWVTTCLMVKMVWANVRQNNSHEIGKELFGLCGAVRSGVEKMEEVFGAECVGRKRRSFVKC